MPFEESTYKDFFINKFEDFDAERKQYEDAWARWNAIFRGKFRGAGGRHEDGVFNAGASGGDGSTVKSKLFVNQTKQAIVAAVSNVMAILFQQLPPLSIIGAGGPLDDATAKMIQQTVWYFLRKAQFPIAARRYITQAAVYGVTYGKVYLEPVRDVRIEIVPEYDAFNQKTKNRRIEVTKEFPMIRFAPVDIFDMWVDPEHSGPGVGPSVFHRFYRTEEYIQRKVNLGIYKDISIDDLGGGDMLAGRDQRRSIVGLNAIERNSVQLLDFWGVIPREVAEDLKIEYASDEYEIPSHCIMLLKEGQPAECVYSERNEIPGQSIPFVKDIWEDVGVGNVGRGIPENCLGPQMALNATINSRIDNKATAIQQILGVDISRLESPEEDLAYKQNWIIRTEGDPKNVLYPLSVPDVTTMAYMEAKEFERMIEEQSGITKYVQGSESYGSNRTAQGISIVSQAASKFIRDITSQFELNLISTTAELVYKHVLQFLPDEFVVQITDNPNAPEFLQIALENIAADVDFVANGVQGLAMKEMAQSQLIQFLQAITNPIDAQSINRPRLLKKIYEGFGFKDADEIIMEAGGGMGMPPMGQASVPAGPGGMEQQMSGMGGNFGQGQ